jgi:ABC-type multidrug transport system ATPase subunit
MNVLAGKASYGKTSGSIKINGKEDMVMNYSSLCGFVPQDDTMMRDLTVEENLSFYARMRLPKTTPDATCDEIVADVIETLGLTHVKHEQIGDETTRGISGGQRKRVNVGMEMVSHPSLLFLDEPTSGLDSATSYQLLEALKELAKKGTNIVGK